MQIDGKYFVDFFSGTRHFSTNEIKAELPASVFYTPTLTIAEILDIYAKLGESLSSAEELTNTIHHCRGIMRYAGEATAAECGVV